MLKRALSGLVREKLRRFPAVAILGPRQSGKTTLARTFSPLYFDLEQPEEQLRLDLQWNQLVNAKKLIVLDEAQSLPSIFPKIRGAIDARRKQNGRFLILGSIAPSLMKNVSESLAGRLALCELSPFLLIELKNQGPEDELWLRGGFPDGGVLKKKNFPSWQKDYLSLLAQRDLPQWGLPAPPQTLLRLFKMLAACHGQIWNASAIGTSLGLSYHTVNHYVHYLQNAFLLTLLSPYSRNIHKRLVKSPKIYWNDSGLLHSLLGIPSLEVLLSQPWVGASWEGWVLNQILSTLKAAGKSFEVFYLRTSDGHELDLVLEFEKGLWAFEFKLTGAPTLEDLQKLNLCARWIRADRSILVSRTASPQESEKSVSTNLRGCLKLLLGRTR